MDKKNPVTNLLGEKLFLNATSSDFTIKVADVSFPAHRLIVDLHTSFFTSALDGGFSEAVDKTVVLQEISCHTVYRLLQFCYTGQYDEYLDKCLPQLVNEVDDSHAALKHTHVYALADMLDISELSALAARHFHRALLNQTSVLIVHDVVIATLQLMPPSDKMLRSALTTGLAARWCDFVDADVQALRQFLTNEHPDLLWDVLGCLRCVECGESTREMVVYSDASSSSSSSLVQPISYDEYQDEFYSDYGGQGLFGSDDDTETELTP